MDESLEGVFFVLGLLIAAVIATAIPDAVSGADFKRAQQECAIHQGVTRISKRAGWSHTIFITCNDGVKIEAPKGGDKPISLELPE